MTDPSDPSPSDLDLSELQPPVSGQTSGQMTGSVPSGWSYEATVADVEAIINRIELGELELADVFSQFSIAVEQLRQCETFLVRQQQQVDLLIETLLDEPEPF